MDNPEIIWQPSNESKSQATCLGLLNLLTKDTQNQ